MTVSLRRFKIDLYEEHLDEMAFLRGQCVAMRASAHHAWQAPAPCEERFEAHLDALVIGGALALEVCLSHADDADPDELFAITTLLCRRAESEVLEALLAGPLLDDPVKADAIAHAMLQEWPADWRDRCIQSMTDGDDRLAPALAMVCVARGWNLGDALDLALQRSNGCRLRGLLACVGRISGDSVPWPFLRSLYEHEDSVVRRSALCAGLRLHDIYARDLVLKHGEPVDLLTLAASRGTAVRLIEQLDGATTDPAVVRSLGQFGELSAVRHLVDLLGAEPVAAEAARALHLITGGEPREQVLLPEPVNEDELSETELVRWRKTGEAPRRADGEPFGDRVDRISQDPTVWGQWLADNQGLFQAGRCYRLGQPCTAEWMLRSMASSALPADGRDALADELLSRHGISLPWHQTMTVSTQWRVLRRVAPIARAVTADSGCWYWAGRPLTA